MNGHLIRLVGKHEYSLGKWKGFVSKTVTSVIAILAVSRVGVNGGSHTDPQRLHGLAILTFLI